MKAFIRVQYRKLGRHPPVQDTWVGTLEEYLKLKKKDPLTLYCVKVNSMSNQSRWSEEVIQTVLILITILCIAAEIGRSMK